VPGDCPRVLDGRDAARVRRVAGEPRTACGRRTAPDRSAFDLRRAEGAPVAGPFGASRRSSTRRGSPGSATGVLMIYSNFVQPNPPGAKFCAECGSKLSLTCPNGHPVAAEAKFC